MPDIPVDDGRGRGRVISTIYPGTTAQASAPFARLSEQSGPMYGRAGLAVEAAGGADNFAALHTVAQKHNLNLRNARDARAATAMMFAERGATVKTAGSWEEAFHAALRDSGTTAGMLAFAEGENRAPIEAKERAAALRVNRERVDLAHDRSRGGSRPYGSAGPKYDSTSTHTAFQAEVNRRMRDLPKTAANRTRVAREILSTSAHLAPKSYGNRG
jgi:hypothetical protein